MADTEDQRHQDHQEFSDAAHPEPQARDQFLDHVRILVEFYDGTLEQGPPESHSTRERLEGLAHGILTAIDQQGFVLVAEDSPDVTDEAVDSAISGVLNDDLFNPGIWSPNQP